MSGSSSSPWPAPLLGHVLADVLPEIAEHRHFVAGDVLRDGDARQLDDAALDGVHEREVAHRPREQRALGIAGAAKEKWRRGQVNDAAEAELAVHGFEAGNPEAGGLVVLLGFLPLVALQVLIVRVLRLLAVAVVRLVVDDEDVLHAHQVGHDALEHLAFGLQRVEFLAAAPLKQRAAARGKFDALAQLEGVVVGDDDLGPVHVVEHVAGNEFAAGVVAVGSFGWRTRRRSLIVKPGVHDEKAAREMLAAWAAHGVDRLPGDQHGHDGGLAAPVASFSARRINSGLASLLAVGEMVEKALAGFGLWGDLGQPDRGFHRLHLAEERADAAELVMSPVLEQTRRLRRDLPLIGIGQGRHWSTCWRTSLMIEVGSYCCSFVESPLPFVEDDLLLVGGGTLALLRLRDRRDELGAAAGFDNLLRRLPVGIQLPMPRGRSYGEFRIGWSKKGLDIVAHVFQCRGE